MTTYFSSYVSFNAQEPDYIQANGTLVHLPPYLTFTTGWNATSSPQILNDMAFLGASTNVKMLKIWVLISQFYYYGGVWNATPNASIANFDTLLAQMASSGIQAYVTITAVPTTGSTDQCVTNLAYYLNPDIVQNNAGTQTAFLTSVSNFINRYKSNTAIGTYDLGNEFSTVITGIRSGSNVCGLTWDSSGTSFTQVSAFLSSYYSTVKGIDSLHPVTFSGAAAQAMGSDTQTLYASNVDYYDWHVYTNDPDNYFQRNWQAYDKDVLMGEAGILDGTTVIDPNTGNGCDFNRKCLAPLMSDWCQYYWLHNTYRFVQNALSHGVKHIFFSYWPDFRWYGIRTDDGSGQYLGHQLSDPGKYAMSIDATGQFHPPRWI